MKANFINFSSVDAITYPLMHVQGLQGDAAALQQRWAALEPRLQGSVAVRGAYIGALCACDALGEAAAALHRMLDLYAVLYSGGPAVARSGAVVDDLAAQEALRPLPGFCRLQGRETAAEANIADADAEASWRHEAIDASASSEQGDLSDAGEGGAAGGACSLVRGSMQERGSAAAPEPVLDSAEEAARAAAQACHQVIHAAGRAGAADVAHEAALAMHEVRVLFFGSPWTSGRSGPVVLPAWIASSE